MTDTILITGATGTAGAEVVRALLAEGRPVRVLVRDAGKARRLFGDAVEVADGDLRTALTGAGALVLSGPDDPRRVAWESAAIEAAAGVRRIVRLSAIGAAPGSPVPFWDWHA